MIIFIMSICILCLMIAILVPVVADVNKHKSKVLALFCDIEDSTVRQLAFRCDRFLNRLQSEETNGDDVESNNEEVNMLMTESGGLKMGVSGSKEEDEEYGGGGSSQSERKKRAKGMTRTSKVFYAKFMLGIGIIEAYFAF